MSDLREVSDEILLKYLETINNKTVLTVDDITVVLRIRQSMLNAEKIDNDSHENHARLVIDDKKLDLETKKIDNEYDIATLRNAMEKIRTNKEYDIEKLKIDVDIARNKNDHSAELAKIATDVARTAALGACGYGLLEMILNFEGTGVISSTGGKDVISALTSSIVKGVFK